MLQQILKDMYIDPDVLNALSEDQKKTLFLKMRQEQVRRWNEREEKMEREGIAESLRSKPKAANGKHVSWLRGRDGDVAVIVIGGEVDEFKASKIICPGFGEAKVPVLHSNAGRQEATLKSNLVRRNAVEPVRAGRENLPPRSQHGTPLNTKGNSEEMSALPPLQVSVSERMSPPAVEKSELNSGSASGEKSLPQAPICLRPPMRASPVNVRAASASVGPSYANTRPNAANVKQTTDGPPVAAAAAAPSSAANLLPAPKSTANAVLHPQEPRANVAQETRCRDDNRLSSDPSVGGPPAEVAPGGRATTACGGRGRVAQLMKTFSADSPPPAAPGQAAPRSAKPPIPSKPGHLRLVTTPSVR